MTIHDNVQKYLYMGREILDSFRQNSGSHADSGLSETNIWGKLAASMVTEEGGALYILDRNNDILMGCITRNIRNSAERAGRTGVCKGDF